MNKIFPPEIINNSIQSHWVKNSTQSKVIYIGVLLVLITALALLPFISVNISTQARGIIRTPAENTTISAMVSGELVRVNMHENLKVQKGDTLLYLDTDILDEQILINQRKLALNRLFIQDINSLLNQPMVEPLQAKYLNEYRYYYSSVNELNNQIKYLKIELELADTLFEKGVMPKQEYLLSKNRYDNIIAQQTNLKEQFYNRWQAEKTQFKLLNQELYSSICQSQEDKSKYFIKAPKTGNILNYSGASKGSFISPGQVLCHISSNDSLLVECYVTPRDIGYLKEGQTLNFQVDAYNYNQWGMANGNITAISNDINNINGEAVFKVRCNLNQQFLELKSGHQGRLKKGMTLTGRFYLTRRTLWQLLFDKVDDWVNPKLIS